MIINAKYKKNQKNGGQPPPLTDSRIKFVPTGCGKCMECRKEKQREWMVRLLEDIKLHQGGKMITLTLSNESIAELVEHEITKKIKGGVDEKGVKIMKKVKTKIKDLTGYDRDNAIATRAMRLFNERWRKEEGIAMRHWMVTELGHNGTENIHLHGIIWPNLVGTWEENWKKVERIWKYGFIWKGYWKEGKLENYVNAATVIYTTKYISKQDNLHKEYRGVVLTSDGIGANYIDSEDGQRAMRELKETYKTSTGHEIALPVYWRNKMFTEEDRERLWIKKLNKEVRWVDGAKIDVSKGQDVYNKAVMEARRKNKELGYGGRINENRKEYEEQRREIMINTRIQKGKRDALR